MRTSLKDSAALCAPAKWYFLWQLSPKRSCASNLVCLTVRKENCKVEDKSSAWALEGHLKAQARSGDPDLLWHWLNLLLLLSSSLEKTFGMAEALVVTSVARVIPGSNIRCVDSLKQRGGGLCIIKGHRASGTSWRDFVLWWQKSKKDVYIFKRRKEKNGGRFSASASTLRGGTGRWDVCVQAKKSWLNRSCRFRARERRIPHLMRLGFFFSHPKLCQWDIEILISGGGEERGCWLLLGWNRDLRVRGAFWLPEVFWLFIWE